MCGRASRNVINVIYVIYVPTRTPHTHAREVNRNVIYVIYVFYVPTRTPLDLCGGYDAFKPFISLYLHTHRAICCLSLMGSFGCSKLYSLRSASELPLRMYWILCSFCSNQAKKLLLRLFISVQAA